MGTKLFRFCYMVSLFLITFGVSFGQVEAAINTVRVPSSQAETLKVMTFNIRVDAPFINGFNGWGERRGIVVDTIRNNAADVVALQEGLDYQIEYIQLALPQYLNYGVGRNDGNEKGEECAILYRKDRFILADCGTFWLSSNPDEPGSKRLTNFFPRICSWVRLIDKNSGTGFYVYNTHLSLSQRSREKSVRILAERIAERKSKEPFIVMGDFNMELTNSAMKYLCTKGSENPYPPMVNAWYCERRAEEEYGTIHRFGGNVNGKKIDHIITNPQTRILDIAIDHNNLNGRYPSDHYAVVATVCIPKTVSAVAVRENLKERKVY